MSTNMKMALIKSRRPTTSTSRCQPDLFNPNIKCLAKETGDDRQCISHFFGRNKTSTASVPHEYFPMLCRKHYQERLYRWNEEPGSYAGYQCDNIIKVLERMPEKVFVDEHGNKWPWWCGFELKLTQAGEENGVVDSMPRWLIKMCSGDEAEEASGVRYNLGQLFQIVKAIKTWCVKNNLQLPRVEALPLTIGMCDADTLDKARRISRECDSKRQAAYNELNRIQYDDNTTQFDALSLESEQYEEEADLAQNALDLASMDAATSKMTIPPKRETKPRVNKSRQTADIDSDVDSPIRDERNGKRPRKLRSELELRKKAKCDE